MGSPNYNYKDANQYVEKRIKEIGIDSFNFKDVNLVKVIQWGLNWYFIAGADSPKKSLEWGKPVAFVKAFRNLRSLFNNSSLRSKQIDDLFIDNSSRYLVDSDQKKRPAIFYNVVKKEAGEKFVYGIKDNQTDIFGESVECIFEHYKYITSSSISNEEADIYAELMRFRKQLKNKFTDEEFVTVDYCLMVFWYSYNYYGRIIEAYNPKRVFYICHYNNEAIAYVCRKKGVKTIELQHGLISGTDLYYCYPEWIKSIRSKALFTDELWVFGQFWKDRLLEKGNEYEEDQIKVKGYFLYENPVSESALLDFKKEQGVENKKIIVVTAQTWAYNDYNEYVKSLSGIVQNDKDVVVVLKLHPRSSLDQYAELQELENVILSKDDLSVWFAISQVHISIYSTTLFDAHRFPHLVDNNYCLLHPAYKDYTDEMIRDKIAKPLMPDENPLGVSKQDQDAENVKSDYFYADYA